ncbi:DUF5693 family protein [Peptoniphilus indolicus]|uniref:Brp/Blh family beta-carotene 15,15'-monooxygenase n=2 Tax=Peptoniphilus indolicus TaxID=33030 RepID=G4D3C5_9FIRM|nr:DUF5693 family protein [Peptoniphilus indolicus]EGY79971.1 hypothetical protein HMPREF9129_0905 [Peptoniphilus indolicus ATCC 29427]SUB75013.1 Uncharacterised protein [Peptoniphilus indolicus]
MQKLNRGYIMLGLILLSVVFSMYFVVGRYRAEVQYKGYDVVADYNQFLKLSYESGDSSIEYFKKLQKNGVTTISLNEYTIDSMRKLPNSKLRTQMIGQDLDIKGSSEELNFIINGLETLKQPRKITKISKEEIIVEGRPEDLVGNRVGAFDIEEKRIGDFSYKSSVLEYVGLGYDLKLIEELKDNGLKVNLRPNFYSRIQDPKKTMERFIGVVEKYNPEQKWIVFSGTEFYSNRSKDKSIDEEFIDLLNKNNMALGLVESSNQRGHTDLKGVNNVIKNDRVRKFRAFTTWDYLQDRYDYQIPLHRNGQELTNVYYRAISERNVAVVFIAPYTKGNEIITDPQMYGNVLLPLAERMGQKGYTAGEVNPIGTWSPNRLFKIPVAIGVVAAGILLLQIIFKLPALVSAILMGIGIFTSLTFFGLGIKENLGNLLFNLAAIVVYPTLALTVIMENYMLVKRRKNREVKTFKIYTHGMLLLLIAILISMIGALNEVSFLSGTNYLVELVEFRGVKISQMLPILFAFVIYAAYIGFGRTEETAPKIQVKEIRNVLNMDVKFWQAGLAGMLLILVAIFLLRGGNTNTKIPGMELLARNLMEIYLPVRPRTKAILMGWPAIVLLMYIAYRKRAEIMTLILILLASIGMADIVNTFSHIRTPLYISFTRVCVQYLVVALIALVFVYVAEVVRKGYDKYIGK